MLACRGRAFQTGSISNAKVLKQEHAVEMRSLRCREGGGLCGEGGSVKAFVRT